MSRPVVRSFAETMHHLYGGTSGVVSRADDTEHGLEEGWAPCERCKASTPGCDGCLCPNCQNSAGGPCLCVQAAKEAAAQATEQYAAAPTHTFKKPPNLPGSLGKKDKKRVKQALKALKHAPDADGKKNRIKVPFPLAKDKPFSLNADDLRGAVHQNIKLKDVVATEPYVRRKRVKKYIKLADDITPVPTVIRLGGKWIIGNGHHRLTAASMLGFKKFPANAIDTQKPE